MSQSTVRQAESDRKEVKEIDIEQVKCCCSKWLLAYYQYHFLLEDLKAFGEQMVRDLPYSRYKETDLSADDFTKPLSVASGPNYKHAYVVSRRYFLQRFTLCPPRVASPTDYDIRTLPLLLAAEHATRMPPGGDCHVCPASPHTDGAELLLIAFLKRLLHCSRKLLAPLLDRSLTSPLKVLCRFPQLNNYSNVKETCFKSTALLAMGYRTVYPVDLIFPLSAFEPEPSSRPPIHNSTHFDLFDVKRPLRTHPTARYHGPTPDTGLMVHETAHVPSIGHNWRRVAPGLEVEGLLEPYRPEARSRRSSGNTSGGGRSDLGSVFVAIWPELSHSNVSESDSEIGQNP
ncbi:hypothetical protein J6590_015418 [Homalodisca vitripennis]|nr:hypothetical protein J6590_015418 [Homalodisca vitripennis]